MDDSITIERFRQEYQDDQQYALRMLYNWVRLGIVDQSTFVACTRFIVPDGRGT